MIERQVDETALTVHGVTQCSFSSLSPNPPNTPLKTSSFLFCCRCMLGYQDLKARPVSSPKRMLKTRTLLRSFYGPGMLPSCALLLSPAAIFHRLRKNPLHFYCPFPPALYGAAANAETFDQLPFHYMNIYHDCCFQIDNHTMVYGLYPFFAITMVLFNSRNQHMIIAQVETITHDVNWSITLKRNDFTHHWMCFAKGFLK